MNSERLMLGIAAGLASLALAVSFCGTPKTDDSLPLASKLAEAKVQLHYADSAKAALMEHSLKLQATLDSTKAENVRQHAKDEASIQRWRTAAQYHDTTGAPLMLVDTCAATIHALQTRLDSTTVQATRVITVHDTIQVIDTVAQHAVEQQRDAYAAQVKADHSPVQKAKVIGMLILAVLAGKAL